MNSINSYIDLCDVCLIDMASEFQKVSQDEEAKYEMKTLSEMCRVKLFMDSYLSGGNQGDEEIISTLASLVPTADRARLKRHFGKIHSFKNPEAGGFVKSNGKIKYGHVGINEKVNTSIHNKNRASFAQKRQEDEVDEDMLIIDSVKTKIASALNDIKELALQKVSTIFANLELNVSVMLEEDLFISDPEATREKNILTEDILSSIKDILNSENTDIEEEMIAYILDDTNSATNTEAIPTQTPSAVEEVEMEDEAIPTGPIDDIFQEVVDYPLMKKSENGEIFEIPEEEINDDANLLVSPPSPTETMVEPTLEPTVEATPEPVPEPTETPTFVVQETYPDVLTDGNPVNDDFEEIEGILPDESSDVEVSSDDDDDDVDNGELGDDESEADIMDEGPHHGVTPIVKPEIPFITPAKPQRPNQPWKFGFKVEQDQGESHRKPSILQTVNKLFEDNKNQYTPSTPEEAAQFYNPIKKWAAVKKSEYVVSHELYNEDIDPEQAELEDSPVQDAANYAPEPLTDEDKSIKLNNPDNHRDNNEEEAFEIGSKKVSFINSVHPTKPSLNFRDNDRKDTH